MTRRLLCLSFTSDSLMALAMELAEELILQCFMGNASRISPLLASGAAIDHKNSDGWTPLAVAAYSGHVNCVEALLMCGANPVLACKRGRTPLLGACEHGSAECVRVLLEAGANHEQADTNGNTPLSVAMANGHLACAQQIIKWCASSNLSAGNIEQACIALLLRRRDEIRPAPRSGVRPISSLSASSFGKV
uniref:Ankyrin repeat domain-containing protein n=1 Tax=Coccolithus braarudii TaxID=221442 RepID=A0A7S0Q219_9EUKA